MRSPVIYVMIFALILCVVNAHAGTARTSAEFLSIDGGTRAAGMADAFSAVSGDVISAFWNPSGLASVSERQATIAYSNHFAMFGDAAEGMYYGLMAFAMPVKDFGVFGTTLQLYDQGSTIITKASPTGGGEVVGEQDIGLSWAWALCYADNITDNLLAGINAKLIRQVLLDESDIAYAADLGLQYALPISLNKEFMSSKPIIFGIALQNFGTAIQMKDANQSEPLPRNLKLGLAFKLLDTPEHRFQLVTDYTSYIDKLRQTEEDKKEPLFDPVRAGVGIYAFRPDNSKRGIGLEYWYANMLGIRVGYKYEPDKPGSRITMGFSIRYSNYEIDYARVPGSDIPGGGDIDKIAILIRF
ncbi:TPA: PorV/PorQ family protein [bacterium]|nr:PorV/PorQ family protein [bacterium]